MKGLLITLSCIALGHMASAQTASGTIAYTETIKLNLNLEDGPAAQFKDLIPKEQSFDKVLYFTPETSLYATNKKPAKAGEEVSSEADGIRMAIKMAMPDEKIFTDIKGQKMVEQREFMGRKFLISSDKSRLQWKLTGKYKKVLSYNCQQAVCYIDSDTVVAWYTSAIPVSTGPQGYSGLPGMILEASHNSDMVITAISVDLGVIDNKLLQKPKEGKKVTKEQFRSIMEQKAKEMAEEYGGGNGNVIIKVKSR